jgi:hypothetical protein
MALCVLDEFLQGLQANLSRLSPGERSTLLAFLDSLDDALTVEALSNHLAGFLNTHLDLEKKLIPAWGSGSSRLGGTAPTIAPKDFKRMTRNIVLRPTTPPPSDGGPQPKC